MWLSTIIPSAAPATSSALIILIKQNRHKAKGINCWTMKDFLHFTKIVVCNYRDTGWPIVARFTRAMGCPLQFLSSVRPVSLCSCLCQIYSDIHSKSCRTLELSAIRILLLTWIGCIRQTWRKVQDREAISNQSHTMMKPLKLKQLCGISWK